jgi:hypothetical protein
LPTLHEEFQQIGAEYLNGLVEHWRVDQFGDGQVLEHFSSDAQFLKNL